MFQTSVYTLGEFHNNRNNSTVIEELEMSIVDLTVANIRFTGSASRPTKTPFSTVKSTTDTSNSSNTVLLILKWNIKVGIIY